MHNVEADTDVLLFYGVYDIKQLLINDNNLIPCIFENKDPWKHEIQIYRCLHNLILGSSNNEHNIFGLFSSSLLERTSLDSKIIKKTINENDNEIFIFSPSQYNFFIYYNFWDQAEVWHKGIVDEIKMIYSLKDNFPSIDTHNRTSKTGFSYCNYWAAKKNSFIKIVDNMITLEKIMLKNCLGSKETYWKSPIEEKFNAVFKKDYKLFPFIVERYISSLLLDSKNNIEEEIFYWNDNRHPLEQVEKIKGLKDVLKNPITRGYEHFLKGTIFKDKNDFYKKIWFLDDIEKLDKVIPGGGRRLRNLAKIN